MTIETVVRVVAVVAVVAVLVSVAGSDGSVVVGHDRERVGEHLFVPPRRQNLKGDTTHINYVEKKDERVEG